MTLEDRKAQAYRMIEEVKKGQRTLDEDTLDFLASVIPNSHVSVKVISQKGVCMAGHKEGDEWLVRGREDGWKSPPICIFALGSLMTSLQLLMYGGTFPWEPDPNVIVGACTDVNNPVLFELRRLSEPK